LRTPLLAGTSTSSVPQAPRRQRPGVTHYRIKPNLVPISQTLIEGVFLTKQCRLRLGGIFGGGEDDVMWLFTDKADTGGSTGANSTTH
jgi:hypothetical protein